MIKQGLVVVGVGALFLLGAAPVANLFGLAGGFLIGCGLIDSFRSIMP
jgi:hypothetical protein